MKSSVLMFCPQFRPLVGGSERQAEKLAVALSESGCRVRILTPRIDHDSPDMEEANGVTIERFPLTDLSRRYPFNGVALLNIPYICWQIVRVVRPRLKGVDILHCHIGSLQTGAAALAGHLSGVPVLCKAANSGEQSDLLKVERSGATGHLVAWLIKSFVGTWVATTIAVADSLIKAGVRRERVVHIPNGVNFTAEPSVFQMTGKVRRFLYMGRLSSGINRDVGTLIEAFDCLATQHEDIELAIVGGGDLLEKTRRLTQTCTSQDRIHLPGFDRPEKWLVWADCFVLPSRWEGLSNALLEAMAAGLPCIANDIPPNREVLDNGTCGILVTLGNTPALIEALQRFILFPKEAQSFGSLAFERARKYYAIENIAGRYLELYDSLL